jgi:eukaryotic-like serine/threonine-protein kinase
VPKVRLLDPTDAKRRLDRYELIGELASGGMATVFLGRLGGVGGFQRFVAIKRLHPHLASEEEFIEMFLDEARLAAGIHHPHVVPILEVGESDSGYYLVMEYIEGDTLARLMARSLARAQPIPRPVLIRIVIDALAGLHAAHELVDADGQPVHLVHRDVSPQNVLVGVDGCSRITDFGVAHAASRLQNTRADRLKGKLAYMSPEQARAGDVDQRADVFSMGIILWEVLAARRLFKGESEAVTLQKVTVEPIPRLSSVVQGAHPALDQVCANALARDPDKRFRSAAEMAEALERAARAAAGASASDLGVASSREVAAYMQGALGEDIAAQRESVRNWLQHSDPSPRLGGVKAGDLARVGRNPAPSFHDGGTPMPPPPRAPAPPVPYDVTFKMPLDRTPVPDLARERRPTLQDVPTARARAPSHPDPGLDQTPVEPMEDDDDEHETLLMDRDAAKRAIADARKQKAAAQPAAAPRADPAPQRTPARSSFSEDGTPSAQIGTFLVPPPPPPNRTPQLVALVVGLVIAAFGFIMWWQLSSEHAPPEPPAPGSTAPSAHSGDAPPPAPAPAPSATDTTPVLSISALPPATPTPPPSKGRRPHGTPSATPSARPAIVWPAPAPQQPRLPEDMANPYRP